jgi:hypothetical protein
LRYKTGTWAVLILMLVFTPLTLVLALTNPVSDCGCFGDAVHLSNWQTFGKNVVLLSFAIFLFRGRNLFKTSLKPSSEWILISSAILVIFTFSVYNLRYLPVIDFLPYKKGVNIPEKMIIPVNAVPDEYYTTFIYEKNGIQKEFTLENYPENDSSWKFVDQKTKLIKKGYQPPIHDFSITTLNNEDITQEILADTGYTFLMISKKLEEANITDLFKGFETGQYLAANNTAFYILTSSGADDVKKYQFSKKLKFCFTDETTLKSMVRSNPGYILLKGGTLKGKWSASGLPPKEKLLLVKKL